MSAELVSPVLVGRSAELAQLDELLAVVAAGEHAAILLGGEAGVGKSRLVAELAERSRALPARVLIGGCLELGGAGVPFGPVVEVLRNLLDELGSEELGSLVGPARPEIARLLPELGPAAQASDSDATASRLQEMILGLIGRLAEEGPVLLVFEDIQWADRSTLELIALLVRGLGSRPLLLVCTARMDELQRGHPLRELAARWEQQRIVQRLELARLDADEVRAQIEAILGEPVDGELVERMSERSEGIPLFVEELLRAVRNGEADRDFLPPSLREVLLARADRLSKPAQRVLRIASAAGRRVPERLLSRVAELPALELDEALREIVEQQLLVVDASARGYGFRHALERATLHEDLLPGERARLHEAYAQALEADPSLGGGGPEAAAMLAHHWLAAHDLARALGASVRAGEAAAAAWAPAEAQRHFETALELWPQVADAEQRAAQSHSELLEAAARAAHQAGAVERALALVDEALAGNGGEELPERWAWLQVRRANALHDSGRGGEALVSLQEAVSRLPVDVSSAASAHMLGALARQMLMSDDMQGAGELARRAVQAAEATGAVEDRCEAQVTLGQSLVQTGEVEEGLAILRAAREEASGLGVAWTTGRTYINLSDALLAAGRHEEAVQTADEGLEFASRAGLSRTHGAFLRSNKAEALFRAGRWEEAAQAAMPGAEGSGVFAGALLLQRAELFTVAGRREQAELDLRAARAQLAKATGRQYAGPLAWVEAELARSGGELERGRLAILRGLADASSGDSDRYLWPLVWLGARIDAEQSLAGGAKRASSAREQDAIDFAELSETMATQVPVDGGYRAMLRGELARKAGVGEQVAWREAIAHCRAMNEPYPLAYSLMRLAESLVGEDQTAASEAIGEAVGIAERLGAAPLLEEARGLARRARLKVDSSETAIEPPATDRFELLGITPRERQVLLLVARGRSNGQIAEELFITRKTASVHVSNILAKLSVSTRGEAAAQAHEGGLVAPGD